MRTELFLSTYTSPREKSSSFRGQQHTSSPRTPSCQWELVNVRLESKAASRLCLASRAQAGQRKYSAESLCEGVGCGDWCRAAAAIENRYRGSMPIKRQAYLAGLHCVTFLDVANVLSVGDNVTQPGRGCSYKKEHVLTKTGLAAKHGHKRHALACSTAFSPAWVSIPFATREL